MFSRLPRPAQTFVDVLEDREQLGLTAR